MISVMNAVQNNDLAGMAQKQAIRQTIEDALWEAGVDPKEVEQLISDYTAGNIDGKNFAREVKAQTGALIKDIDKSMTAAFPEGESGSSGYVAETQAVLSELSRSLGVPAQILQQEASNMGVDTEIDADQVYSILKQMGLNNDISYAEIQNIIDSISANAMAIKTPSSLYRNAAFL